MHGIITAFMPAPAKSSRKPRATSPGRWDRRDDVKPRALAYVRGHASFRAAFVPLRDTRGRRRAASHVVCGEAMSPGLKIRSSIVFRSRDTSG